MVTVLLVLAAVFALFVVIRTAWCAFELTITALWKVAGVVAGWIIILSFIFLISNIRN